MPLNPAAVASGSSSSLLLEAIYTPAVLDEHRDNPLIEALPEMPPLDYDVFADGFADTPKFHPSDLALPAQYRLLAVDRLENYIAVLNGHHGLFLRIHALLRSGYVNRNVRDPEYRKALAEWYHVAKVRFIPPIAPRRSSTAPSLAIFGVSGMGKTTSIERMLCHLPQGFRHGADGITQVVWVKVDIPKDAAVRQMQKAILEELDAVLGTDYALQHRRSVSDELTLATAKIAARHNLGMLVIDEINNLLDAKWANTVEMQNFFVTFSNAVRIPLVFLGTKDAERKLKASFQHLRRLGTKGTFDWDPLHEADAWEEFFEGMLKYQWIETPLQYDKQISAAFRHATCGIVGLAVSLFRLCQTKVILDRREAIDDDVVQEVRRESFARLEPHLEALREGRRVDDSKLKEELASVQENASSAAAVAKPSAARAPTARAPAAKVDSPYSAKARAASRLRARFPGLNARIDDDLEQLFAERPNLNAARAVEIVGERLAGGIDHASGPQS